MKNTPSNSNNNNNIKLEQNNRLMEKDSFIKSPSIYPMLTRNDFSKSATSSFIKAKKESILKSSLDGSPIKPVFTAIPSIKRIKLSKQSFLQSRCRSRPEIMALTNHNTEDEHDEWMN